MVDLLLQVKIVSHHDIKTQQTGGINVEDIEQTAVLVRNAIRDIPKIYESNCETLRKLDLESQDLLHLIEFRDMNASEGYKVYKELQKVRRERRKLKNENDYLKPLLQPMNNINGSLKNLDDAIGEIRKEKMSKAKLYYNARTRKDLEPLINGVKL